MYTNYLLIRKVIIALEKLRAGKGAKKWQGGGKGLEWSGWASSQKILSACRLERDERLMGVSGRTVSPETQAPGQAGT